MTREKAAYDALADHVEPADAVDRCCASLALAAADAWDAAHGVHRIVLDDATMERAARAIAEETFGPLSDRWDAMDSESRDFLRNTGRAVLAAAVKAGP